MQEAQDAFKSKATSPTKHAGTVVATQELELTDSELSAIVGGLVDLYAIWGNIVDDMY
jgi:bacteriocin-like protein